MRERVGLLGQHRKFFDAYRARFAEVFLKVCKILNPEVVEAQVHFLRQGAVEIYDRLFTVEAQRVGSLKELEEKLEEMEEHGVSISVVLTKVFSVMTHDFVDYAMKTGNAVAPVRVLTGIMTACLALLDTLEESPAAGAIDEDEGRILTLLDQHSDQMVRLETLYQGVPLNHEGLFLAATDGRAAFHLGNSRETIFEFHEEVLIHAPFLEKPVLGRVVEVDDKRREITVSGLHYSTHNAATRAELRVQPRQPIPVELKLRNERYEGLVIDISLNGMALSLDDPGELKVKDWVHLEMELPHLAGGERVVTRGEVARISERRNSFRVGLVLRNPPNVESLLSEYVTNRQAEVIRQVQASTHEEVHIPMLPRERPWVRWVTGAVLVVVMMAISAGIYYSQPDRGETDLVWEATAEWLAKQRECQQLSDNLSANPNPRNTERYQRCNEELKRLTAPR
ncbi:PilZ domain-containing protein [Endothiovibrio diazotrophicus]